jgi:tRNA threonylcarbamoyladenosine biosynthesis protein TsaB
LYRPGDLKPERVSEYTGINVTELSEMIASMDENIIFSGDAVSVHGDYLRSKFGSRCHIPKSNLLMPKASSTALMAFIEASSGRTLSPTELEPFYLRVSQAEREYLKKISVNKDNV